MARVPQSARISNNNHCQTVKRGVSSPIQNLNTDF